MFRILCLILIVYEAASFNNLHRWAPPRGRVCRSNPEDGLKATAVVPEPVDGDPREALKQFGSLFEQLKDIATQVISPHCR
jgi:hypothetical protein